MKGHVARKSKARPKRVMCLASIAEVHEVLKAEGHRISRNDLYELAQDGKLPMICGKTTPEAVVAYFERALGLRPDAKALQQQSP